MARRVSSCLSMILSLGLMACGGGDNVENKTADEQTSTDEAVTDEEEEEKPFVCSGDHEGFEVKFTEGRVVQNASFKNGMLQINGLDVNMAYDSYLKKLAPESYPYNNIQIEIYASATVNYPITTGKYKLGTTEEEKNPHTCNNCVFLGVDINKKGNPQKKLFATSGVVEITTMEDQQIKATLKNASFVEYTETYNDESGDDAVATLLPDGETWCVNQAVFDGTSFQVYHGI